MTHQNKKIKKCLHFYESYIKLLQRGVKKVTKKLKIINETMLTKARYTAILGVALFVVFAILFVFSVVYMFL